MRKLMERIRLRLGDFWWYSIMLFCAYRTVDALNAFVGLWIVPKYISPEELGAVVPLSNFANCLALPLAAFANAFRNEVSRLSTSRNMGQLKTLLCSVFAATGIFLAVALVAVRFILPLFLERIRIAEGSLGFLILAASFLGAISPIDNVGPDDIKVKELLPRLTSDVTEVIMATKNKTTNSKKTSSANNSRKKSSGTSKAVNKKPSKTSVSAAKSTKKDVNIKGKFSFEDNRQKTAIILGGIAVLFLAATLIKGEHLWLGLHNLIFGLFGITSFLWPLFLIYLTV